MKHLSILLFAFIYFSIAGNAQTSPSVEAATPSSTALKNMIWQNDTVNFDPYQLGTVMTTQYLNQGVVFSGYNGSGPPDIYEYGAPQYYGRVLKSDNWFNALRINFTDTANSSQYKLAQRIEFDNIVDWSGEVDLISVDAYDSMNVLIYHYLSASPEHVVLNFASPSVAYITIDDSAGTAYVIDNILVDFGNTTDIHELSTESFKMFPNPSHGTIHISNAEIIDELKITDLFGQIIYNLKPKINKVSLQLEKAEIYFVTITANKNTVTRKFIIAP